MDSNLIITFIMIFIMIFGAATILLFFAFRNLYMLRLIENTPRSKIRSLAMGPVEIFGKSIIIKEFIGPFSGKKCTWCKWYVQEYQSNGKSGSWHIIKSGKFEEPFYLEDETGKVLINPRKANIDVPSTVQYEIGQLNEKSKKFLEENGIKIKSFLGLNRRLRFIEESIFSNEKIYIFGTAKDSNIKNFVKNEDGIVIEKGKAPLFISNKEEVNVKKLLKIYTIIFFIVGALFLFFGIFFTIGMTRI